MIFAEFAIQHPWNFHILNPNLNPYPNINHNYYLMLTPTLTRTLTPLNVYFNGVWTSQGFRIARTFFF